VTILPNDSWLVCVLLFLAGALSLAHSALTYSCCVEFPYERGLFHRRTQSILRYVTRIISSIRRSNRISTVHAAAPLYVHCSHTSKTITANSHVQKMPRSFLNARDQENVPFAKMTILKGLAKKPRWL